MMRYLMMGFICCTSFICRAQSLAATLDAAWQRLAADSQLQCGLAGICVMDAQTGELVFGRNENTGMAPASTQKIFTTIAAFEALGKGYRYGTKVGYTGNIIGKKLVGDLVIEGSGDFTLGSGRYVGTRPTIVLGLIKNAIQKMGIDTIAGNVVEADKGFNINPMPDGWTWGDMGNYYGTGHWALNWAENQYDLHLVSGETDAAVAIKTSLGDADENRYFHNELISGDANTGDGSVIYAAPFSATKLVQGKITSHQQNFTVAGSFSFADENALEMVRSGLQKDGIAITGILIPSSAVMLGPIVAKPALPFKTITTIQSPSLDSIVYWFLKKSINLYGEGLLRTIGLEKEGFGSTENGLKWVDSFYRANHFDSRSIHLVDGSGLSPTNRVTPVALAKALQFAKTKAWFPAFYDALPTYNNMKLKSGTIHRTKCFAGYHTSKNGRQYIVAMMVNNYNGSTSGLVSKMYAVLDVLK